MAADPERTRVAADREGARMAADAPWTSMAVNCCGVCLGDDERILEHTGNNHQIRTFQVIQIFKNLPDLLLLPAFLAFSDEDYSDTQDDPLPNMEIIRSMLAFEKFAHKARKRHPSGSDALNYACHNWAFHLLRAPKPWDDTLDHTSTLFWNNYLLSWLERQWCLKGLRSCLIVLSEGQKLKTLEELESRKPSILPMVASHLLILR